MPFEFQSMFYFQKDQNCGVCVTLHTNIASGQGVIKMTAAGANIKRMAFIKANKKVLATF